MQERYASAAQRRVLLTRPVREWGLVYVSRNMQVVCQIPCVVDNPILSNGKCTLRLHRRGRPPRPTSLSRLSTFSRDKKLFPVCISSTKSHIQMSSLVPARLTFCQCWQGALGVRWARLSSGFLYCCYSVAYIRNNTLLLPQLPQPPPPRRPGHNPSVRHKRVWISHDWVAAWEQTNLIVRVSSNMSECSMCLNRSQD